MRLGVSAALLFTVEFPESFCCFLVCCSGISGLRFRLLRVLSTPVLSFTRKITLLIAFMRFSAVVEPMD